MGLDTEEEYVDEELPPIRLVICREDLPENPRWREYKYPEARCWDVYELFLEAKKKGKESLIWQDARRVWWEQYWRAVSRYRRKRPFWRVYECDVEKGVCRELPLTEDVKRRVMMEINIAGFETGVVPRGARVYPWRPYKKE